MSLSNRKKNELHERRVALVQVYKTYGFSDKKAADNAWHSLQAGHSPEYVEKRLVARGAQRAED